MVQQSIDQRTIQIASGGMDDQTGRLVDHDKMRVFEHDGERNVLRLGKCGRRFGDCDRKPRTRTGLERWLIDRLTIQCDPSLGHQCLDTLSRQAASAGQRLVEPLTANCDLAFDDAFSCSHAMQMGMDLMVTSGAMATLLDEAACAVPEECCGLLLGQGGKIEEARPAANVAADRCRHFEIDPLALIAAHRAARGGGLAVLGYFHSHPIGEAVPSATDRAQASGDGQIWAIIAGGQVRFWRDLASGFEALSLRVVEG